MLDDLFQAGTDAALNDLARRPPAAPAPEGGFSFWRMLGGVPRGLGAGLLETQAAAVDLLGPFGDVMAAYGGLPDPAADRERRRKEADEARRRIQSGEFLEMNSGDRVRATVRENLQPDAETSHTAEQVVYGFARLVSAAATGSALGGLPGAVAVAGVSEGMSAADELKREGVDLGTRTAAGMIAGAGAGLGVALPVSGGGIAGTAALVGLGGPVAFVAQQAATRAILENADYSELADQYDPFDPVGLWVSFLAPAVFGAYSLRGRVRPAKGKEGGGDLAGQPPDSDVVDAARVSQSSDAIDAARLTPADDFLAAQAHVRAMDEAMTQMAMGERVDVSSMLDTESMEMAPPVLQNTVELVKLPGRNVVDVDATEGALPPVPEGHVRLYRAESPEVSFSDVFDEAQLPDFAPDRPGQFYTPDLKYADYYRASYGPTASIHYIDLPSDRAAAARVSDAEYIVDLDPSSLAQRAARAIDAAAPSRRDTPAADSTRPLDVVGEEGRIQAEEPQAARVAPGAEEVVSPIAAAEARLQEIIARRPDLQVRINEAGDTMRLDEVVERIRAESQANANDADLIQVAANCFLSSGL